MAYGVDRRLPDPDSMPFPIVRETARRGSPTLPAGRVLLRSSARRKRRGKRQALRGSPRPVGDGLVSCIRQTVIIFNRKLGIRPDPGRFLLWRDEMKTRPNPSFLLIISLLYRHLLNFSIIPFQALRKRP
jgi:hypothetical protein